MSMIQHGSWKLQYGSVKQDGKMAYWFGKSGMTIMGENNCSLLGLEPAPQKEGAQYYKPGQNYMAEEVQAPGEELLLFY